MFAHLIRSLKGHKPKDLPQPDEKLALGALLVRVAKSDKDYNVMEIKRIDRIITRMYGLNAVAAAKMRATCELLEQNAPHMDVFSEMIREGVDFDIRFAALEAMWQVVLADGAERPEEIEVIIRAKDALGLSEADNYQARANAAQSLGAMQT
ncbi:TerB family tellurite resistance protein [Thalassovita sp.]|uniref:tellurite resistance TerB family protein n=1 Tax=Thalassovita sp. TaxID=1979401 RepID=UPI0029DE5A49|nr:TerB family tellurite resistance protein [Thalassovita sp.]